MLYLYVDVYKRQVSGMDEVVWPGAMDFKCDSEDWYTLLNWGQGLLIPNGWETTLEMCIRDRSKAVSEVWT